MTFPRFALLAAGIAAAVTFAPALAQEHEVGHWFGAPAAPSAAVQPTWAGGVLSVSAGDAKPFNGVVSRFQAGGRAAVHATPLDDPRLAGGEASAAPRAYDVTMKRGTAPAQDMTLKGQKILLNAQEGRPAPGGATSVPRVRMAQPHTSASVLPPRVGWDVQADSAPKTALPATGVRPAAVPGGQGASTRR